MRPTCFPMTRRWPGRLPWLVAVAMAALAAQAEPASRPRKPDPLDPKVNVPALRYFSPFKSAREPGTEPPLAWRDANDNVARIGGWRSYAREAQAPASAPAAPTQGHGDHKTP